MPLCAEARRLYYSTRAGWPGIRARILARAGHACECAGHCGAHAERCGAPDRALIRRRRDSPAVWRLACGAAQPDELLAVRVRLGVAHLNHNPADNREENLLAICQRCHIIHDRDRHRSSRAASGAAARREAGQLELWAAA